MYPVHLIDESGTVLETMNVDDAGLAELRRICPPGFYWSDVTNPQEAVIFDGHKARESGAEQN